MTTQNDHDTMHELMTDFIALANQKKDAGHSIEVISAALMSASGTYITYVAAGNEGYLQTSGIDKVTAKYKEILENIQATKKATFNPDG